MLTFDAENHIYHFNGNRVPNVTTILSCLSEYASVPRNVLEEAAARGNYVHEMCELHLQGALDESSIEINLIGYLDAFKKFLSETNFQTDFTEQRVFHSKLLYAGTFDIAGAFPAIGKMKKPRRALIDIKTTFKLLASVGPQTAAYADAWASSTDKEMHFDDRYGLQLKAGGNYKLQKYNAVTDLNVFRSCLSIYNFMRASK